MHPTINGVGTTPIINILAIPSRRIRIHPIILAGNVADMSLIFPEKACCGDTRHAKRGPDIPNLYQ